MFRLLESLEPPWRIPSWCPGIPPTRVQISQLNPQSNLRYSPLGNLQKILQENINVRRYIHEIYICWRSLSPCLFILLLSFFHPSQELPRWDVRPPPPPWHQVWFKAWKPPGVRGRVCPEVLKMMTPAILFR